MKQHELIALREKVLKRIRQSLIHKTEINSDAVDFSLPVFSSEESLPEIQFAKSWSANGGKFFYGVNDSEIFTALRKILSMGDVSSLFINHKEFKDLFEVQVPEFKHLICDSPSDHSLLILFPDFIISNSGSIALAKHNPDFFFASTSEFHIVFIAALNQVVPSYSDFKKLAIAGNIDNYLILGPSAAANKLCFAVLSETNFFH